jgi:hypothetical protein
MIQHVLMLLFVLSHRDFLFFSKVTVAIVLGLQSRENLAQRPLGAILMWITCQKVAVGTGGECGGGLASSRAADAACAGSALLYGHVQQTHRQEEFA